MRAKFMTNTTEEQFKNVKYKYTADPSLQTAVTSRIDLKSALFNLLIPYCANLLKDGIMSISNIPTPESIKKDTDQFFSIATGGFGAFVEHFITENVNRFIPFNKLLTICTNININGLHSSNETFKGLSDVFPPTCFVNFRDSNRESKIRKEVGEKLVDIISKFFGGKFYKVREEVFLDDALKNEYMTIIANEDDPNPCQNHSITFKELKDKFLEPEAKSEVSYYSKEPCFNDIVIGEVYWNVVSSTDPITGDLEDKAIIPK